MLGSIWGVSPCARHTLPPPPPHRFPSPKRTDAYLSQASTMKWDARGVRVGDRVGDDLLYELVCLRYWSFNEYSETAMHVACRWTQRRDGHCCGSRRTSRVTQQAIAIDREPLLGGSFLASESSSGPPPLAKTDTKVTSSYWGY